MPKASATESVPIKAMTGRNHLSNVVTARGPSGTEGDGFSGARQITKINIGTAAQSIFFSILIESRKLQGRPKKIAPITKGYAKSDFVT